MVKVGVMYANTSGARFDHEYYRDEHMPLVKEGPRHQRWLEATKGSGQVLASSSPPKVASPVNA
jgi:uncharacterized protein (TIGR02118 family)